MARTNSKSSSQTPPSPEQQPSADAAAQQAPEQQSSALDAFDAEQGAASAPTLDAVALDPWAYARSVFNTGAEVLAAAPVSADSLHDLQETRASILALLAVIDGRVNEAKDLVAERAAAVEIVEPRQFSVPNIGNILPGRGQRFTRERYPKHFAAIVSQLRHGEHFLFV